ncbi:tRNA (adenosine(37)-N6)-threonylcarbamoyltransferase complex transferase subunit TsaD [candidate division WOR-3 bacterium]|nr:tRNA (adenosine(37)-N6)-threonylcarbamoyltransferase complex transferase subunit TsaD [candidate division WOR-3 bacterium]
MLTLGIETSCDETAIGIIEDKKILANLVSSQIAHTKFGGVVPELAARNHIKIIMPLTNVALEIAKKKLEDVDLFSVTRGPGLIGALLVGLSFAKSLAIALDKPVIGINHLEGHIYALHLEKQSPQYPYLVLLVSGGHTEVVLVRKEFDYETLGKTVDDACGEAFDKVAKLLGFPYPGGPYIEEHAKDGRLSAIKFPVPKPKEFNFSYAGLKTAVLYYTRDNPNYMRDDVAVNFQEVAIEHLIQVVSRAIESTKVKYFGIVGGVSVNKRLRHRFSLLAKEMGIRLHIPGLQHCTDNGVMIALAGAQRFEKFGPSDLSVDAVAREALDKIRH